MSNRTWVLVEFYDEQKQPMSSYCLNYDIVNATAVACEPSDMTPQSVVTINSGNGNMQRAKILCISDSKEELEKRLDTIKAFAREFKKLEKTCTRANKAKRHAPVRAPGTSKLAGLNKTCGQDTQTALTPSVMAKIAKEFDKMMNRGHDTMGAVQSIADEYKAKLAEKALFTKHNENRPARSGPLAKTMSNVTRTTTQNDAVVTIDKDKQIRKKSAIQDRTAQVVKNMKPNQTTDSDMHRTLETCESVISNQTCERDQTEWSTPTPTRHNAALLVEEANVTENLVKCLEKKIEAAVAKADDINSKLAKQSQWTGYNDNEPERYDLMPETMSNETSTKTHDDAVALMDEDKQIDGSSGNLQDLEAQNIESADSKQTTDSEMVTIGHGNARIQTALRVSMNWNAYAAATRRHVEAIFREKNIIAAKCKFKENRRIH